MTVGILSNNSSPTRPILNSLLYLVIEWLVQSLSLLLKEYSFNSHTHTIGTTMKFQTIATAIALTAVTAPTALAGTYSTNTYINGHEVGKKKINVTNVRTETGNIHEFSQSAKIETNFPNVTGNIKIDGTIKIDTDFSTNGPDPFTAGTVTTQQKDYSFNDITTVGIKEKVDYFNDIYTHTVESGAN